MSVTRNAAYNLAGFAVPMVLFVVTIPLYIALIGAERYGVLAIVWLVLGMFGMMDLGLGRAATQRIASLKDGTAQDRSRALGTALTSNLFIGAIGAVVMGLAAWYMFAKGMKLDAYLRAEALPLVPLMAVGVPIVTTLAILNGALMGREKFFIVNRITITNTSLFQLVPLAVAWAFGPTLVWLVLAALIVRVLAVGLLWRECRKEFGSGVIGGWDRAELMRMLRYGGWVTAAGMIGMVVVYSDRLMIGAIVGASAVAVYTIAFDTATRIAIIPNAINNALFPRIAAMSESSQKVTVERITTDLMIIVILPLVAAGSFLASPVFTLWLGKEVGLRSAVYLPVFLAASLFISISKIYQTRMLAEGRAGLPAKLVATQAVLFIPLTYLAIVSYGLLGAAVVFSIRCVVDLWMMAFFAAAKTDQFRKFAICMLFVVAVVYFSLVMSGEQVFTLSLAAAVSALAAFALAWFLCEPKTRALLVGSVRKFLP